MERNAILPGICTAFQLSNGEVQVKFLDGSQLWFNGKHQIKFRYPDGVLAEYKDTENIPRQIMAKMQHMPKILKHLTPNFEKRKAQSLR